MHELQSGTASDMQVQHVSTQGAAASTKKAIDRIVTLKVPANADQSLLGHSNCKKKFGKKAGVYQRLCMF